MLHDLPLPHAMGKRFALLSSLHVRPGRLSGNLAPQVELHAVVSAAADKAIPVSKTRHARARVRPISHHGREYTDMRAS